MENLKDKPEHELLHRVLLSPYFFGLMHGKRFFTVIKNCFEFTDEQFQVLSDWIKDDKRLKG